MGAMTKTALGVAVVIAIACNRKPDGLRAPTHDEVTRAASQVELPTSGAKLAAPPIAGAVLVVSTSDVRLVGDPRPIASIPVDAAKGLADDDKRNGRADLFVTPLAHALTGLRAERGRKGADPLASKPMSPDADAEIDPSLAFDRVVVLADRRTTYRVLSEIVFSAFQSEMSDVCVVVRSSKGLVELPVHRAPPRASSRRAPITAAIAPTVELSSAGIDIRGTRAHVAPGCNDTGPGTTIPALGPGSYDFDALAACMAKLKKVSPDSELETEATITATGDITLQSIVTAMEAMMATRTGDALFPDIAFGVPTSETR